jgi:WD repeat-containing protein 81
MFSQQTEAPLPPRPPGIISGSGVGNVDNGWRWLLPGATATGTADDPHWSGLDAAPAFSVPFSSWRRNNTAGGADGWRPSWNLSMNPLHSWPAHRDKLRAMAVDDDEWVVVTSGRGTVAGQETEVSRISPSNTSLSHHSTLR